MSVSLGVLEKIWPLFLVGTKVLMPFKGHVAGVPYPPHAIHEMRAIGDELEQAIKGVDNTVQQMVGSDAEFLERERALMHDIHEIYKTHDAAVEELRRAEEACVAALKRLEKKKDTRLIEPAVLALEKAVVAAREVNVSNDTISSVQITLTNARANLRTLAADRTKKLSA